MPDTFWQDLLDFYVLVFETKAGVPKQWKNIRCVLIPKPASATERRPISVATVFYRLVSSCIVANIAEWVLSWADESVLGGVPGRSSEPLHLRLSQLIDNEEF